MTTPATETLTYEHLTVEIQPDMTSLGQAAAAEAAHTLQRAIEIKGQANLILATGNSQLSLFEALRQSNGIDWGRVHVFHMDEYLGLPETHPASFRSFIRREIVEPLGVGTFYGIEGDAADPKKVIEAYTELLKRYPADLCCMGIGENGHIAFNDPPYADFNDSERVKIVELDEVSRRQQVMEGHFPSLEAVPKQAITLTIPTLLAAKQVLVIVPETRKAKAVRDALEGPIVEDCPASVLRRVSHAMLYLDTNAASLLSPQQT